MLLESVFVVLATSVTAVPPPEALSQNKEFLHRQLKGESPDLKINALDKLGELKFPDSIPVMAEALNDPDAEVRFHAIRALSKNATPEALAVLQEKVAQGKNKENDPYLTAELRRSIKNIEDLLKASSEAATAKANKASKPSKVKK